MTSRRQIEANRANARKSTGPQTDAGKIRSGRNAYRHGLSRWDCADDSGSAALADVLMAELPGASNETAARELAQARTRRAHIRALRLRLILALVESPEQRQMRDLLGLERYEMAARARQRRGLKRLEIKD